MVEYIKHQGEVVGNLELTFRLTALENAKYHAFKSWASVVRQYARFAWSTKPTTTKKEK